MSLLIDQPETVDTGIFYTSVAQHRQNVNSEKSKWRISIEEEFKCFRNSLNNGWYVQTIGWGLYLDYCGRMLRLGVTSRNENLYFAKFIDSSSNNYWHGWPADYRRKPQDRPPTPMLQQWRDGGFIKKHQIAKILGGKVCNF